MTSRPMEADTKNEPNSLSIYDRIDCYAASGMSVTMDGKLAADLVKQARCYASISNTLAHERAAQRSLLWANRYSGMCWGIIIGFLMAGVLL